MRDGFNDALVQYDRGGSTLLGQDGLGAPAALVEGWADHRDELYETACRAVAAVLTLGEAGLALTDSDFLRSLAKRAKNRQMEVDAAEIRIRAERQLGILLGRLRAEGRLRPGPSSPIRAPSTDCVPEPDRVTLRGAGIDERLGDSARKHAAIPADEFERRLDDRRAAYERDGGRIFVTLIDKQAAKAERRAAREVELGARVRALPERRFGLILDDPEWCFEVWSRKTGLDRAADNHYPTSDIERILARPVTSLAAPDCAWFRWATVPMLAHAIRSIEVDGFIYKTNWVWAKDRIGTGYWNRNRHEHLLLAVRGDVPCPAPGQQWDSLLEAPVGAHSAKPDVFYEMIESHFENVPKVELNRRGPTRVGWDASWGNEAEPPEVACTVA